MVERWGFSTEKSCWAKLHILLTSSPILAAHPSQKVRISSFEANLKEAFYILTGQYVNVLKDRLYQLLDDYHWRTFKHLKAIEDKLKRKKQKSNPKRFMRDFEDSPEHSAVDITFDISLDL